MPIYKREQIQKSPETKVNAFAFPTDDQKMLRLRCAIKDNDKVHDLVDNFVTKILHDFRLDKELFPKSIILHILVDSDPKFDVLKAFMDVHQSGLILPSTLKCNDHMVQVNLPHCSAGFMQSIAEFLHLLPQISENTYFTTVYIGLKEGC